MNNININSNWSSSEGRHDDESALVDFLASLMDYTPTVSFSICKISWLFLFSDSFVFIVISFCRFRMSWWSIIWQRADSSAPTFDCRIRLVAVAAQKFIADVANDALQHCRARQSAAVKDKKQQKDKRLILTMEDLSMALREYGVNLKRQEYFADNPSTGLESTSRDE